MSPAAATLARSALQLPTTRIEALARLMEAGSFPGDPLASARGAASVALVHLAGAAIEHLPRLAMRDWLPDGRQVVILDPPAFYTHRREALMRCVSVPDAAVMVVTRYLGLKAPYRGDPDAPLLSQKHGTRLTASQPLQKALKKACASLGIAPAMTLGEARALYCKAIEGLERGDGLYEYMCGIARSNNRHRPYSVDSPPPDAVMKTVVANALPLAAPWRRLGSSSGPSWSWARNIGSQK